MLNTWQISIRTFSDAHWIIKFSVQHKNNKKTSPFVGKNKILRRLVFPSLQILFNTNNWFPKNFGFQNYLHRIRQPFQVSACTMQWNQVILPTFSFFKSINRPIGLMHCLILPKQFDQLDFFDIFVH